MPSEERTVRPDSKGRVTLGNLAPGASSFRMTKNSDGSILLVPYAEIPARELWLHKNPEAMASVKRGLQQATEGNLIDRGDFSQYAEK